VAFKGIDFANTGGGLRIFGHRGGGGTVDTVLFEDIRGRNMNYLLELNMWYVRSSLSLARLSSERGTSRERHESTRASGAEYGLLWAWRCM
jgi:polygalacturonase